MSFTPQHLITESNPWPVFDQFRGDSPVQFDHFGEPSWAILKRGEAVEILSDPTKFVSSPAKGMHIPLIHDNGDRHRHLRSKVREVLAKFDYELFARVENFIDARLQGLPEEFDFHKVSKGIAINLAEHVLGLTLFPTSKMKSMIDAFVTPYQTPATAALAQEMFTFFFEAMAVEKENKRSLLVTMVANDETLDDTEKVLLLSFILVAAADTLIHGLTTTMACVIGLLDPDQRKVGLAPEYVRATMHRYTPVKFMNRRATVHYGPIKPGDLVSIFFGAANTDPSHWKEERYSWKRAVQMDSYKFSKSIPFGMGTHACPGRSVAMRVMTSVVEKFTQMYPRATADKLSYEYQTACPNCFGVSRLSIKLNK